MGNGKLRGCKNVTKIKRLEKLIKKRFKNVMKLYRVSTTAARFIAGVGLQKLHYCLKGVHPLRSLVTSVLSHFGPFLRTELTEDRSD